MVQSEVRVPQACPDLPRSQLCVISPPIVMSAGGGSSRPAVTAVGSSMLWFQSSFAHPPSDTACCRAERGRESRTSLRPPYAAGAFHPTSKSHRDFTSANPEAVSSRSQLASTVSTCWMSFATDESLHSRSSRRTRSRRHQNRCSATSASSAFHQSIDARRASPAFLAANFACRNVATRAKNEMTTDNMALRSHGSTDNFRFGRDGPRRFKPPRTAPSRPSARIREPSRLTIGYRAAPHRWARPDWAGFSCLKSSVIACLLIDYRQVVGIGAVSGFCCVQRAVESKADHRSRVRL